MTPFNEAVMLETLERLERENEDLKARITALEMLANDRAEIDARRSSIEVGTPAKGGALKVYLDPFGDSKTNEDAVNEAKRLLAIAGGSPLPPAEAK